MSEDYQPDGYDGGGEGVDHHDDVIVAELPDGSQLTVVDTNHDGVADPGPGRGAGPTR
jgi:hypothetical protein